MKIKNELGKLGKVIEYFIDHNANEYESDFFDNVNKLINIKAELHEVSEDSTSKE